MTIKISKISQLTLVESYIQININDGFKYIDKTGEILNLYSRDKNPEVPNIGVNGVDILNPIKNIDHIRITPFLIWARFDSPNSMQIVFDNFINQVKIVSNIIDVKKANQISLRNRFIYELSIKDNLIDILKKFNPIDNTDFVSQSFTMNFKEQGINANIIVQIVEQTESKNKAILVDYDIYIKKEIDIVKDINNLTQKFSKNIQTNFLEIINQILD